MAINLVIDPKTDDEALPLYESWRAAKRELDRIKVSEHTLRIAFLKHCFGDDLESLRGSKTVTLSDGSKFNAKFDENTKVEKAGLDDLHAQLGDEKYEALFRFTPALVNAGYKALSDEERLLVDEFLETKAATPGLADKTA